MSITAVTIGTASWRAVEKLSSGEVEFTGVIRVDEDGLPLMVWDDGLNNMRAMTDPEVAALPAQEASAKAVAAKSAATAGVDDSVTTDQYHRLNRAVALIALDAFNTDRVAMAAMNSAVQAATSLADLKIRFSNISFPNQVTIQQLNTAVKNKIAATSQ